MTKFVKSDKLKGVCYDIRGPVLDHANWLEEQGQSVIKLNIGNPGAFGFDAPDESCKTWYRICDRLRVIVIAKGYSLRARL